MALYHGESSGILSNRPVGVTSRRNPLGANKRRPLKVAAAIAAAVICSRHSSADVTDNFPTGDTTPYTAFVAYNGGGGAGATLGFSSGTATLNTNGVNTVYELLGTTAAPDPLYVGDSISVTMTSAITHDAGIGMTLSYSAGPVDLFATPTGGLEGAVTSTNAIAGFSPSVANPGIETVTQTSAGNYQLTYSGGGLSSAYTTSFTESAANTYYAGVGAFYGTQNYSNLTYTTPARQANITDNFPTGNTTPYSRVIMYNSGAATGATLGFSGGTATLNTNGANTVYYLLGSSAAPQPLRVGDSISVTMTSTISSDAGLGMATSYSATSGGVDVFATGTGGLEINLVNSSNVITGFTPSTAHPGIETLTQISAGRYLLSVSGGGLSSAYSTIFTLASANTYYAGPAAFSATGASAETFTNLTYTTPPSTAYWLGTYSGNPGVWSGTDGSANSNWNLDTAGTATPLVPGTATNVVFSTSGAGNQGSITLGGTAFANSITVNGTVGSPNETNNISITGGSNTLYLGSTTGAGILVNAGSGTVTLNANVTLGIAQTWTNNSSNALAISAGVNNAGFLLTTAGSGNINISGTISGTGGLTQSGVATTTLSGSNTYSGTTSVTAGTLQLGTGTSGQDGSVASTAGVVLSNSAALVYNLAGTQNVGYAISGTGSLTKLGSGTLALGGVSTYAGATIISAGTLKLSGLGTSVAGTLTNNAFTTDAGSGIGTTSPYGSTGYTEALSFNHSGLTINGLAFTSASQSGTHYSTTNWGNNVTNASFAGAGLNTNVLFANFIYGNGSNTQTLTITGLTPGSSYDARVYYREWEYPGSRAVNWTFNPGTGTNTTLSSANEDLNTSGNYLDFTYTVGATGTLILSAADLSSNSWHLYGFTNQLIGSSNLLPTNTPLTVASGATLDLGSVSQQVASISGSGTVTSSTTTAAATLTVGDTTSTTFSGQITDSGTSPGYLSLTKVGTGTLTLTGSNTYAGGTTISAGTLVAGISNATTVSGAFGPSSSGVTLGDAQTGANNSAVYLLNAGYTVSNPITVSANATTGGYTIGGSNTSGTSTYTGNITLNQPVTLVAANGGTTVFKTGTWTTNSNAVSIGSSGNAGTVEIDSTIATGVTVNYGTLSGKGTINGAVSVQSGAVITSGTSTTGPQTLTLSGTGLILYGGSTYNWYINNGAGGAGAGYDQLVTNGISFDNSVSSSHPVTINISGNSGVTASGTFTYVIATSPSVNGISFPITVGAQSPEVLADTNGTGVLQSLFSITTTGYSGAENNWQLVLVTDGSGQDLELTTTVPEPGSLGLLGVASVGLLRRRRSSRATR